MKYLFFDTETTGLPRNYKAPVTDAENWPRLVQLAWILCEADGTIVEQVDHIVKPDGWTIGKQASDIHGITTERAWQKAYRSTKRSSALPACFTTRA